jgi:transcription initiation factor IIE alpha subunit
MPATTTHCHTCGQRRTFQHFHDLAHGIAGTHMAGSERFTCEVCGESTHASDNDGRFTFMFDREEAS